MRLVRRTLLLLLIAACSLPGAAQRYAKFTNGALNDHWAWRDTSGNLINAHDGGILYTGGRYYWYGMALRPLPVTNGPDGGQKTTIGVVMYSSRDLYNWDYDGVILACSNDPHSSLYCPMRFERPKILYNDRTRQYVMWFHYVGYPGDHGTAIGSGEAGVAVSDRIDGPYTLRNISRPIDSAGVVRDFTLFKDDDGKAYFIYDRDVPEPNPDFGRTLHVVQLTDDYLGFSTVFRKITNASRREAPVVVKRHGLYYLITSAETGWKNNAANYYRSSNILGPYLALGNPARGAASEITFNAQGTFAFRVQGKADEVLLMVERHITDRMTDSSYIFLPVKFPTSTSLALDYLVEWQVSEWPR